MSESLSMKCRLRGLTMFVFSFGVESLELSVKAGSARNFRFPSPNTTFSKPSTKEHCFLQCFRC